MIIGITGGVGTGKTTVAKMFSKLGGRVISADKIARRISAPKTRAWKKLLQQFGEGILYNNKCINRKKLAEIAFSRKAALSRLCEITHPEIVKEIKREVVSIKKRSKKPVIIIEAPLLIEAKAQKMVDKIIVVSTSRQQQIKRAVKSLRLSKTEVLKRIKAQMPLKKR